MRHRHFAALAAILALLAAVGAFAGLRLAGDSGPARTGLPAFLADALGPRQASASPLRNLGDEVRVELDSAGYAVTFGDDTVALGNGVSGRPWRTHVNGVSRPTAYGREVLLLAPRLAEQFLAVERRQGKRLWHWRLETGGLAPRLAADGSVELWDGVRLSPLGLTPVAIFDAEARDVTPGGLAWRLAGGPGDWRLELELDDAELPLPYVIDPGVVLSGTATADNGAGSTSLTIAKPAGVLEGDVLVAQVTVRPNVTIAAPAGWTAVRSTNNGAFTRQAVFRKAVGATDPGPYTFSLSAAARAAGGIVAYNGVQLTAGVPSSAAIGNTATPTASSINPGATNTMLVALFGIDNGDGIAPPAGMTERWDVVSSDGAASSAKVGSESADVLQAANAATGAKAAAATTSGRWVAHLLALRPDVTNPTVAVTAPTEVTGAGSQFYVAATRTQWFRPASSGSFVLNATSTDTSGVRRVTFPDLTTAAGWSGSGGDDLATPYASPVTYAWSAGAGSPGVKSVTSTDFSGNVASQTVTVSADAAGPTGMVANLVGGPGYSTLSIPLNVTNGTDAGSGVDTTSGFVQRDSAPLAGGVCSAFPGTWATVALSGGADTSVVSGTCYRYRRVISDNVGNQSTSGASATARVDTTGPSAAPLTLAETPASGAQHVSGTTLYYRPGASGTFTVTSAATDAESGIASVTFPAIPPVAGGSDATSPYQRAYAWTAATSATGPQTVTARNGVNATGTTTFTLVQDSTAPAGGSVDYPDGYAGSPVTVTTANGADADSGVNAASGSIQRSIATLSGDVCGSFGPWTTVTSPNAVASGLCVRYRYSVSDNVGNVATYTSPNVVKHDSSAPSAPVVTLSESSPYALVSGTTVVVNPAQAGSFQVDATTDDPESGIERVSFPSGVDDTAAPYSATYGLVDLSGLQTVTAQAYSGLTASAPFTVVQDTTAPSGGSVSYPDGYATGSVTITTSDGSDAEAGVDASSGLLERATATLAGGACGSFGSWTAATSPDTVSEGECASYRYSVADNVGNVVTYTSANVARVDTSAPGAPSLTLVEASPYVHLSGLTAYVNPAETGSFDVAATAEDAESGIASVAFPNGMVDASSPFSATYGLADLSGLQTVAATNGAGLAGPDASFTVVPDTTAPAGGSIDYPDGWNLTGDVTISTSDGSDAGSGLDVSSGALERATATLAGGACGSFSIWSAVTSPDTVASGVCARYRYRIADNVGNIATYTSANVVLVDTTGPTVVVDDPGSPLAGTAALTATADDPEAGITTLTFEVSPAGADSWTTVPAAWDTTGVPDGLYDVRAVAENTFGETAVSAPVADRLVDNTSPGGGGGPSGQYLRGTVELTATPTDTGSGIASVAFRYRPAGGGPWTTIDTDTDGSDGWSASWDTTGAPDGDYDLEALVTDNAANTGMISIGPETVDNTAPVASIDFGPSDPAPTATAAFGLASNEAGSTFECSLDAGAFASCSDPKTYSGLALGPHTFDLRTTDPAGNTSGPVSWSWTVVKPPPSSGRRGRDKQPPTVPLRFYGEFEGEDLVLHWLPAEDDVGVVAYLLLDRGAVVERLGGERRSLRVGPFGHDDPRVFTLAAADANGNVGPATPALRAVPDVAGMTEADATAALAGAGFAVGETLSEASTVPAGRALRAGDSAIAEEGAALPLVLSTGVHRRVLALTSGRPLLVARQGRRALAVLVTLAERATVRVTLRRRGAAPVATWRRRLAAGRHRLVLELPTRLRDGRYRLTVTAVVDGRRRSASLAVTTRR